MWESKIPLSEWVKLKEILTEYVQDYGLEEVQAALQSAAEDVEEDAA